MTVAELIAKLQEQPQDATVAVGYTLYSGFRFDEEQEDANHVYLDGAGDTLRVVVSE